MSRLSRELSISSLASSEGAALGRDRNQQDRPMPPELPSPIAEYVEANARLDLEGMIRTFAADAVLWDNGKRFEGQAEIRALLKEMVVDLKAIFTPEAVRRDAEAVVMEGSAHGDFAGSPIHFTYRVEVDGDAIKTMDVSA